MNYVVQKITFYASKSCLFCIIVLVSVPTPSLLTSHFLISHFLVYFEFFDNSSFDVYFSFFLDGLPGAWFWRNLRRQLLHLLMLLLLLLLLANHVTVMAVKIGWRWRQRVTLIGWLDRGMILIGRLPRRLNGSSTSKEKYQIILENLNSQ